MSKDKTEQTSEQTQPTVTVKQTYLTITTKTGKTGEELIKEKLQALKNAIDPKHSIYGAYNTDRIRDLEKQVNEILGKDQKANKEFNFKTGGIIGLLRTAVFKHELRQPICQIIGVPENLILEFSLAFGNTAYYSSKQKKVIAEKNMNIAETKKLLKEIAALMELIIDDEDLNDFNPEYIAEIYRNAREEALKAEQDNADQRMTQKNIADTVVKESLTD